MLAALRLAVPAACLLCGIVPGSCSGDVCFADGDAFELLGNHR